jgi:PAS domain S-box-containing protein
MELSFLNDIRNCKTIIDAINDAVFIHLGDTGEIIAVNQAMCQMYGYTQEEALRLSIEDLSSGETPFTQADALDKIAKTTLTEPQRFEWHAQRKDGELFWVEVHTNRTNLGGVEYLVVIVRDIDHQVRTVEQLRLSEEKFSAAFHTAADMISISRVEDSVFLDVNESALEVLGYSPEELIGQSALELGIWPIRSERERLADLLREKGYFRNEEAHLRKKDGKVIVTSISGNLIPIGEGLFVLSNVRDINELIEANEKIEDLNRELEKRIMERTGQLEAANRELEAFSYSVSHDLRAPLRSIEGFTRIAIEEIGQSADVELRNSLEKILNSSLKMEKVIDGLLGLSRLDRTRLNPEILSLDQIADQVFSELMEKEDGRKVDLKIGKGLKAYGDPVLLRILLTNLISNAIKYTKKQAAARILVGTTDSEHGMVFYVQDNGIGFDPKYSKGIFEPFQRLHDEQEYEGVGIGLAIARRIVEHHNGNIWVESEEERGATFFFTLDLPEN